MLAIGVPPIQANATNTVALWPGQLTSVWALRTDLRRDLVAVSSAPHRSSAASAAPWSCCARRRSPSCTWSPGCCLPRRCCSGISGPISRWLRRRSDRRTFRALRPRCPLFFAIIPVTFYIGYFGAGAGFLLMSALALFGIEEMNALNSLKVLAACTSNFCAVVTFIFGGAIVWHYCLVSMVFAGIGGYVGAQYARRMNPEVLRTIVVVTGCTMAAYFFWRQP
jgi:uncharacterized membrane protein YfcA